MGDLKKNLYTYALTYQDFISLC